MLSGDQPEPSSWSPASWLRAIQGSEWEGLSNGSGSLPGLAVDRAAHELGGSW